MARILRASGEELPAKDFVCRNQGSDVRCQMSDVRNQRSEVRGQGSETH
ncbi:MAG: hypothetical protein FWC35_06840 [Proteobacteria bacterium]|nr:hypothetical protein [Pseudomonadota bacterium]